MKKKNTESKYDPNSPSLLERTRYLLDTTPISDSQISIKTGLSYYWIRQLKINRCKSASVDRVQALYEFLTNEPLLDDSNGEFKFTN